MQGLAGIRAGPLRVDDTLNKGAGGFFIEKKGKWGILGADPREIIPVG
jgi:hypothetical protein